MSIYLPNIEMPPKGQMLVIFPDGTIYVCFNGMRERLMQTTAVPVPPHGRLGDLDALTERFWDGQCYFTDAIKSKLQSAPTIIPAEEEDGERRKR